MKNLLLTTFIISIFSLSSFAQIFSQNFNSSTDINSYVNSSGELNLFTGISTGTNNPISAANNSVRFTKTGGSSGYFVRNVNLAATTPTVLKIGFTFQVSNSSMAGTTQAQFYVGNGFTNSATIPTGANTHSKIVFDFGGSNDFNIKSSTAPTTPTAAYNTKQNITWVINNTSATVVYLAPDGLTQKSLASDKWDLYVGTTSTPVLPDRDGLSNSTAGEGKDNVLQNFYFSYPSGSQHATIDIDDILINDQTTVLPVTLLPLTAKASGKNINLVWKTASETNNSHFDILRSGNADTFTKIGTVNGAGTTQTEQTYAFTDINPLPGINYYKLRQVDLNGAETLFEPVSARSNINTNTFKILTSDDRSTIDLTVFAANVGTGSISIYDLSGRKLTSKSLQLAKGYNSFSLPSAATAQGLHIATLTVGTEIITNKFLR